MLSRKRSSACLCQQRVQPPAQQRSFVLLFRLGLADVGPGGAFPLDAEEVVGGWEMGREKSVGVERLVERGQQATGAIDGQGGVVVGGFRS
jgi:hypothetical protein